MMRLEKVSGEGPKALYNLFYKEVKIAGPLTKEALKAAINRLEQERKQEVKS